MPQSYTVEQPTTSWGRDTEHYQPYDNKKPIKVKQQVSLLSEMIANLETTLSTA